MKALNIIDFDERFDAALTTWMEKNRYKYKKPEDMEEAMPEVYEKWLDTPAAWLDGKKPGEYFDQFTDANDLCELLKGYIAAEVSVPDPLLDRLEELADEDALMSLLLDGTAPLEARMCAVELLRQLDSRKPMVDFIRWQVERKEDADLLDNALDSLRLMGTDVVKPAKVAFTVADEAGKEALLDVLADYPGDEDVFNFALNQFKTTKDKRALYAGYLAKLGDDHALEALLDVAESDDVNYADFLEIRSAIERLGSDAPVRDWSKDPTYQAFRRLERVQMPQKKH